MEKESGGAEAEGGGSGERDPVVALVSPVDWERARVRKGGRAVRAEEVAAAAPAVREGRQEGAHAVGGRRRSSI